MNYMILAAGRSKRFGRNKLEEKFEGKSLPRLAAEFAVRNGAKQIFLTLSRSAVRTDGIRVYHPVLDDVSEVCCPRVRFQDEDTYGPGAAISAWSGVIEEPFTVLFGDNYYRGDLGVYKDTFSDGDDPNVYFTYLTRTSHPRNLQLAAVVDNYVVEKPHSFVNGNFFCGLVRFPKGCLNNLGRLRKSDRGEVEITDMINMAEERRALDLHQIGLSWDDLTYETDVERVRRLVEDEGK